jgi:divalent metal cation (Fe/Co/Zn/Cd) transporter
MHTDGIEHERLKEVSAITIAGGLSNGMLAALKIGLGTFTGYLPLTASGYHSLSDIVSDSEIDLTA